MEIQFLYSKLPVFIFVLLAFFVSHPFASSTPSDLIEMVVPSKSSLMAIPSASSGLDSKMVVPSTSSDLDSKMVVPSKSSDLAEMVVPLTSSDLNSKMVVPSTSSDLIEMVVPSTSSDLDSKARTANLVVSKDGTGNYKTINEAVAAVPAFSKTRFVIYVKKGIYDEIINIGKPKTNLTIIGDGRDATILTEKLNVKDGTKTFYSATLAVDGDGFMAQDLCIRNTAGPEKGAAVALRVSGDRVVIYRCHIDGYQDTLYAHSNKQFYRDCYITGTVDFICGQASAVFQNCQIEARKPIGGQSNVITAQSRDSQSLMSGFTFQKCNITASKDLDPVKRTFKSFLGRPWGVLSRVVFMESFMGDLIDPAGWTPWDSDLSRLSTLYYGEYENNGPGADTKKRVTWKGFRKITDPKEAINFTVGRLLDGDVWLKPTGVPYELGL
ncbi:PREDICTED: probable pectinesterase 56 [Camelina sativa]|uniref:Pectinesterase n=1 Tax=Camelina sativa TaxID=90675 RepID=A0ABM1QFJ5_CAMSA|nr:PREDICTED: probable pectinesterase 56 [Camelina sativa]